MKTFLNFREFMNESNRASGFSSDAEHYKELNNTGYWGSAGAGVLFFCSSTKKFLLSLRSGNVEQPGTWGIFGGAIDKGESPEEAAVEEVREESGIEINAADLIPLYVFKDKSFQYFNFLYVIDKEFTPTDSWETDGHSWVEYGKWESPLHFGVQKLLADPESVQKLKEFAEA